MIVLQRRGRTAGPLWVLIDTERPTTDRGGVICQTASETDARAILACLTGSQTWSDVHG